MPENGQTYRSRLDEWEKKLKEQIGEGGLLLGELGFIEKDLDEIGALLANTAFFQLRQKRYTIEKTLDHVRHQWPLTFALYLVLEGIYHYNSEDQYWHGPQERLGLKSNQTSDCGRLFLEVLAEYDLPTFAFIRSGHTYIMRILLHGGIPNELLPELFAFLWKIETKPHRLAPDTGLLLQLWRKDPELHLISLPRSVKRFLLYGEMVAADFVERCLDLFYTDSLEEAATLVDLPRRVIKAFWSWREKNNIQTRRSERRIRLHRPILTLAPYTTGIALYLPPQQFFSQDAPTQLTWVWQVDNQKREAVSTVRQRIEGGYQYGAVIITPKK